MMIPLIHSIYLRFRPILRRCRNRRAGWLLHLLMKQCPLNAPPITGPVSDRQPLPEQRVIQLGQGPIQITEDGRILQNGGEVGQLSVEEFHEPQWLEKMGNSYFRNTHPNNLKNENVKSKIHQGFVEGSNVNPVSEMTRLIEATRAYESHMQAVRTYQDIDSKSVNEIAKER